MTSILHGLVCLYVGHDPLRFLFFTVETRLQVNLLASAWKSFCSGFFSQRPVELLIPRHIGYRLCRYTLSVDHAHEPIHYLPDGYGSIGYLAHYLADDIVTFIVCTHDRENVLMHIQSCSASTTTSTLCVFKAWVHAKKSTSITVNMSY